ncbi:hypothetical protein ABIC16_002063 [Sphingomonas sp. PvP055]
MPLLVWWENGEIDRLGKRAEVIQGLRGMIGTNFRVALNHPVRQEMPRGRAWFHFTK